MVEVGDRVKILGYSIYRGDTGRVASIRSSDYIYVQFSDGVCSFNLSELETIPEKTMPSERLYLRCSPSEKTFLLALAKREGKDVTAVLLDAIAEKHKDFPREPRKEGRPPKQPRP